MKIFLSLFLFTSLLAKVPLQIEQARTERKRAWGLMGRHHLDEDQGMLFIYPKEEILHFWMFNCYFPLSIAFLDRDGVIQEIRSMPAYPEKMIRPIHSLEEIPTYSKEILSFFSAKGISSSMPVPMALEMNLGWFERHGITKGDRLIFSEQKSDAYFLTQADKTDKVNL